MMYETFLERFLLLILAVMRGNWLQESIERQRTGLSARLGTPLARLAERCAGEWNVPGHVNRVLMEGMEALSPCHLLYAIDPGGKQLSANVGATLLDTTACGQNLADRPYLVGAVPETGFLLSEVYVSRVTARPCVTAVQAVTRMGQVVGYLAADFNLRDLPQLKELIRGVEGTRQIKGDPSIRETVFNQQRTESEMDRSMPELIAIMDELLGERGVFHAKLHFSSSRATLWLTEDPYRYRLHVLNEIIDPSVCLAYPLRPYSDMAVVTRERIESVFRRFALLRNIDDMFYLRSASLNLINGLVGLTFSCDGTYYLPVEDFLARDERFWQGV
jgi:hypothetical protein